MEIGDFVTYDGRVHAIVGFTPMSVMPAQIELRERGTNRRFWIDLDLVGETVRPERAALRATQRKRAR